MMSGLEVVGLVLGSIPLVISALEHYRDGIYAVRIWRRYVIELASIIRQLRVQQCILMNICEILLGDLGLPRIDAMIRDPYGPLWRDDNIKKRLTERLNRDYNVFEATVEDMSDANQGLKERIGLGPDGKIGWMERSSWKRELKRASFTFNRSQYQDFLRTLKEGNECLETFVRQNKDLEPWRQKRSQPRYLNLFRIVSENVFRALRSSLSCSCNHGLGLELSSTISHEEAKEHDRQIVSGFRFRVGISGAGLPGNRWKEFLLAPSTGVDDVPIGDISALPSSTPKYQNNHRQPFRGTNSATIRSDQSTTCTETQPPDLESLLISGNTRNMSAEMSSIKPGQQPIQIVDICSTILNGIEQPPSFCYGFVSTHEPAEFSKFAVHAITAPDCQSHDLITLDQILECNDASLSQITYTQKIRQVYLVSNAVLQPSENSWLDDCLSSKDIIFVRKNNVIDYDRVFIGRDIFSKSLPPTFSKTTDAHDTQNRTLLVLAVVLIEIMLRRPFRLLRGDSAFGNETTNRDAESELQEAHRLATRVHNEYGWTFGSAIRRCIDCDFDCDDSSLESETFRQEFYANVVALLKDNMEYAGLA